jgi:hypothetical protein
MPLSTRMNWSIPTEDADPWYDRFTALVNEQDQAAYASREDRNLILMGGGSITWTLSTNTLAWSEPIRVFSPVAGFQCIIEAGSANLDEDGRLLHAPLVRFPQGGNKTIVAAVAGQVPVATDPNSQLLFALRWNDKIYWRNGLVQGDGVTITNFEPAASFVAGGDLTGSATNQIVKGFRGRTVLDTAPTVGQVYKWNGSAWVPSADAAGTMPTFVYRPGEGSPSGNVYASWTSLMSAFGTIEGPVWIEIDSSITSPAVIDAGILEFVTWDLEGRAHLVGKQDGGRASVQIGNGVVLADPASMQHLYVANAASTGNGKISLAADGAFYTFDCEFTSLTASASLVQPFDGSTWYMRDTTITSGGATYPVIRPIVPELGGSFTAYLEGFSAIPDNVFSGTLSTTIDVYLENGWTTCSSTHPDFLGTLNIYAVTSAAVQTTFVFRPGGTAGGNVYTSWSSLMTDLAAVNGPKIIEFDASQDGNLRCDIPAGTWNLGGDTILRGKPYATGETTVSSDVLMADGAIFQNALELDGYLNIYSSSTSGVFTWSGQARRLVLRGNASILGDTLGLETPPSSPLINALAQAVFIEMYDRSSLGASAGDESVLYAAAGADCIIDMHDASVIGDSTGGVGSYSVALETDGGGATILVNIHDQSAGYLHLRRIGVSYALYAVRQMIIPFTKGVESNASTTPASCGAGYLSFKSIPKHENMKCYFRAILETTNGSAGYEAYIDLYDVHGQLNGGIPQAVPGSEMDTWTGSPPDGAPTPNALVPSLYETDLTSAIVGGTWEDDIAIFESRVWIGTAAGGSAATCKSAELVFEWTEEILLEV